jgi:predicted nucleic-acid-binding Zn-ribbon protein
MSEQESVRYRCPKCGGSRFKTGKIRATEEDNSSFFAVKDTVYHSVICARCGFTELYEAQPEEGWSILKFLGID